MLTFIYSTYLKNKYMKFKEYMSKSNNKKLGSILVKLFAGGLAGLTLSVALGALVSSNSHLNSGKQAQFQLIANGIDTSVHGYLNKLSTTINMVASDPNTVQAIKDLNDHKGALLGDTTHVDSEAVKELQRQLDLITAGDEAVMHTYIGTNKDKFQKSPVESYDSTYKASQRGWYKQAKESGNMLITEPYADASNGKTCLTLAMPVKSNGNILGVLGFDLDLGYIMSKSNDLKIGETGFTNLIIKNEHGDLTSIFSSSDEMAKIMNDKIIVDGKVSNSDKEVSIPGLTDVIENATAEIPSDVKFLTEVKIDGTRYRIQAHNDPTTGMTKIMGVKSSEYTSATAELMLVTIVILGLGGAATLYLLGKMINKIGQQISEINDAVSKLKEGDLTVELEGEILKSQHEVGQLARNLNDTASSLKTLMGSIVQASESLGGASNDVATSAQETNSRIEEIATTMNEIVEGISEQASSAQESSATMAQLSNKLDELQQASITVTDLTAEVRKENEQGISSVNELQFYTDENNKSTAEVANTIDELSKKTASIETIVETMSAIAEQTNLLALNAAIEVTMRKLIRYC